MQSHGGVELRGAENVPHSSINSGRFGRMFRRLPPMPPLEDSALQDLAAQMREEPPGAENPRIPAGYTYLGQFIDHDITFDPVSSLQRQNDPDALHSFRTPRYDLDSVYGSGPADEPFMYQKTSGGTRMFFEPNKNTILDLPRNSEDVALIGDPRNDENTIVGQLHLTFLKLHNAIHQQVLFDTAVPPERKFEEAQQRLRWHYQWVVVHDYLPRVCGDEVANLLFSTPPDSGAPEIRLEFYNPKSEPFMPVEYSAAAFRFGHSQVRATYHLNEIVRDTPIFVPDPPANELADLRGFRRLPSFWTIDWGLYFVIDGSQPQLSNRIDSKLTPALFDLPASGGSLAFRNLKRGLALGLPSGQDVARFLEIPRVLTGAELGAPEPTPLWFYILKESELVANGEHLGPVGARIVAEVLLGLLKGDPKSWFNIQPTWRPTLPDAAGDGRFTMADLLKVAITEEAPVLSGGGGPAG